MDSGQLTTILNDIIEVRAPWRSEWLDADFKVKSNKLYINYEHQTKFGRFTADKSDLLEDCLMQDKGPGIDLQSWIDTANYRGFPSKNVKDGSIHYWYPRSDNNSVAGFYVGSGRADLVCDWYPTNAGAALGVRAIRRVVATTGGSRSS